MKCEARPVKGCEMGCSEVHNSTNFGEVCAPLRETFKVAKVGRESQSVELLTANRRHGESLVRTRADCYYD